MRMTRERKYLFSALALGLIALGADRVFLGATGPAQAGAAEDRAAMPAPRAPSTQPGLPAPTGQELPAIDQRTLDLLEQHDPTLSWDPFVVPASWGISATPEGARPVADAALDAARGSLPNLTAVMASGAGRRAILDGQPFAVGETIGSWTIATIDDRGVVLVQGDARVVLELGGPQLSGRGTVGVAPREHR